MTHPSLKPRRAGIPTLCRNGNPAFVAGKSDTASNQKVPEQEAVEIKFFDPLALKFEEGFLMSVALKEQFLTETIIEPTALERAGTLAAHEYYNTAFFEQKAGRLIDGRERIEHDSWADEPKINARTAIFEELTAKAHHSEIEFDLDVATVNERTLRRLLNGWSDNLPAWEQKRRFYEIVEELIIQQAWEDVQAGTLPPDTIIGTLSDYPEAAQEDEAHIIGYRFLNHKGMVRATHFERNGQGEWHRIVEQISRSNSNDGSSTRYLKSKGVYVGEHASSQEVLASSFLTTRTEHPDGVVSIMKNLDNFAGPHVRYGEDSRNIYPSLPAYDEIREVSHQRESQAEYFIDQLADFERKIDLRFKNGQISYEQKLAEYHRERTKLVDEICLLDPSYAKDARGEESAEYYEMASLAMASGDDELGRQHFEAALRSADPRAAAVCGGIGFDEQNLGLNEEGKQMYQNAKDAREFWKWKKGLCVVNKCPTRPNKVEVGPCSVCRKCQGFFDVSKNPNRIYKAGGNLGRMAKSFVELVAEPFREWNKKYDAEAEQKKLIKLAEKRKTLETEKD